MDRTHDVSIVGGGVVGCSVLYELTSRGYDCVLLDKNCDLVAEASSGNSGMLHTGFDAPTGSAELDCIRRCQSRIFSVLQKLGCPLRAIGATMVAWNQAELEKLPGIQEKSRLASVTDTRLLSVSELYRRESGLSPNALAGVWIPGESVIDPWLLPVMLAENARQKNAKIVTNAKVTSFSQGSSGVRVLETTAGSFRSKCVINCAGLYGDIVDTLAGFSNFRIRPRKGQYTVFSAAAKSAINSSILPVPTEKTKGIIVFKSVYDNVIVGPTAEDVESRLRPLPDNAIATKLQSHAGRTVGSLVTQEVVGMYTGVRPATETKDYVIKADNSKGWVTVGGIRSTGVSGSLGIAEKVYSLVENELCVEPTFGSDWSIQHTPYHFTRYGTAVVGQHEYRLTHPITIFGTKGIAARM